MPRLESQVLISHHGEEFSVDDRVVVIMHGVRMVGHLKRSTMFSDQIVALDLGNGRTVWLSSQPDFIRMAVEEDVNRIDGFASFNLRHNQSLDWEDIPVGSLFTRFRSDGPDGYVNMKLGSSCYVITGSVRNPLRDTSRGRGDIALRQPSQYDRFAYFDPHYSPQPDPEVPPGPVRRDEHPPIRREPRFTLSDGYTNGTFVVPAADASEIARQLGDWSATVSAATAAANQAHARIRDALGNESIQYMYSAQPATVEGAWLDQAIDEEVSDRSLDEF